MHSDPTITNTLPRHTAASNHREASSHRTSFREDVVYEPRHGNPLGPSLDLMARSWAPGISTISSPTPTSLSSMLQPLETDFDHCDPVGAVQLSDYNPTATSMSSAHEDSLTGTYETPMAASNDYILDTETELDFLSRTGFTSQDGYHDTAATPSDLSGNTASKRPSILDPPVPSNKGKGPRLVISEPEDAMAFRTTTLKDTISHRSGSEPGSSPTSLASAVVDQMTRPLGFGASPWVGDQAMPFDATMFDTFRPSLQNSMIPSTYYTPVSSTQHCGDTSANMTSDVSPEVLKDDVHLALHGPLRGFPDIILNDDSSKQHVDDFGAALSDALCIIPPNLIRTILVEEYATEVSPPHALQSLSLISGAPRMLQLAPQAVPLWNGPFIPQSEYQPRSKAVRQRVMQGIQLSRPLLFPPDGLSLDNGGDCTFSSLAGGSERVLLDRRMSISIRLNWPGLEPWSKQIASHDYRNPRNPITLSKLAMEIKKVLVVFFEKNCEAAPKTGSSHQWSLRRFRVEDLVLVSVHHVSQGSWQPYLRLHNPLETYPEA